MKEYWIVDPDSRTIELFTLRQSSYALVGKYGPGESVASKVLEGFEANGEEICPAVK